MADPSFRTFNRTGTGADQASFDVGLRAHMLRVYNYMASGLALSGKTMELDAAGKCTAGC